MDAGPQFPAGWKWLEVTKEVKWNLFCLKIINSYWMELFFDILQDKYDQL